MSIVMWIAKVHECTISVPLALALDFHGRYPFFFS